jgi:hypothetical protein
MKARIHVEVDFLQSFDVWKTICQRHKASITKLIIFLQVEDLQTGVLLHSGRQGHKAVIIYTTIIQIELFEVQHGVVPQSIVQIASKIIEFHSGIHLEGLEDFDAFSSGTATLRIGGDKRRTTIG